MVSILKIIYEYKDHYATEEEINKILKSNGFSSNVTFNHIILNNSKRVKNFLKDPPALEENGKELYWARFFTGKMAESFEYTLKPNLIKALENYYDGLEEKYYHNEDSYNESSNIPKKSFYKYLTDKGFYFDKETIENYLLSLKVKPFVILTGNSGTGKTKLSQLFVEYLEQPYIKNYFENVKYSNYLEDLENKENLSNVNFKVNIQKPSYPKKDGVEDKTKEPSIGWLLGPNFFKYLDNFFPISANKNEFSVLVEGTEYKMNFNPSPRIFAENNKDILVDIYEKNKDKKTKPQLDFKIYYDKEKIRRNLKIWESKYLNDNSNNSDFCKIIPVGANWTDNRNIIGYQNVITGDYEETPAFRLIKSANSNIFKPYFLILDEMNLSHVERYFADFLSAIESGKPIPLYGKDDNLSLPENLSIIGTVNVDETTYMFSPKVLDRANIIEFKTLSAEKYMFGEYDEKGPSGELDYLYNVLSDLDLRKSQIEDLKKIFANVQDDEGNSLWNTLSDEITEFQTILAKSRFDFGFRVINEILRFMVVAWKYEKSPAQWDNWQRYFDAQIKQKMLPKLHGSERIMGATLENLLKACAKDKDNFIKNNDIFEDENSLKEVFKYPKSAKKLEEMAKILKEQRYVSFIN